MANESIRRNPLLDHIMQGTGTDDWLWTNFKAGRIDENRFRLRAAEAPVRADQLLKGGHLISFRPIMAVDQNIRAVGEAVFEAEVLGRIRSEA